MESKHTRTPWQLEPVSKATEFWFPCGHLIAGPAIIGTEYDDPIDEDQANAAFIVRACNSHDQLVEVCAQLAQIVYTQNGNLHDDINQLLANAKAALDAAGAA